MNSFHFMFTLITVIGLAYCIEWFGFQFFLKYPYRYGIPIITKLITLPNLKCLSTKDEQFHVIRDYFADSDTYTYKMSPDSNEIYIRRQFKYFTLQNVCFIVGSVYCRDKWVATIRIGFAGCLLFLFIFTCTLCFAINIFDAAFIVSVFLFYIGMSISQYVKLQSYLKTLLEFE